MQADTKGAQRLQTALHGASPDGEIESSLQRMRELGSAVLRRELGGSRPECKNLSGSSERHGSTVALCVDGGGLGNTQLGRRELGSYELRWRELGDSSLVENSAVSGGDRGSAVAPGRGGGS